VEGWERKYGWIGLVDTLCLYEQEKAALADTKEIGDE